MVLVAWAVSSRIQTQEEQAALQPFYDVPSPLPGPPGTVIRTEPLGVTVPGATALRMLYVSERPDGTPAASGGMLFIPDSPAPPEGRPVVAWAHGTLGMGDACAPSRSANPLADTDNWLDQMMQLGWVVAADRLRRASARRIRTSTSSRSRRCATSSTPCGRPATSPRRRPAPATRRGGTARAATRRSGPATWARSTHPSSTCSASPPPRPRWSSPTSWARSGTPLVGWVIGSDVVESWPQYYPDLPVDEVLTPIGQDIDARLASECIKEAGQEALARKTLGQQFFAADPTSRARVGRRSRRPDSPAAARGHAGVHRPGHGRHRGAAVAQRHRAGGVVRGRIVDLRCCGWAASTTVPQRRRPGPAQWRGWTTGSRGVRPPARATPRRRWRRRCRLGVESAS